jgi:polyisoprenoid-binding protein YceI
MSKRPGLYISLFAIILLTTAFRVFFFQTWALGDSWSVKFSNAEVNGSFSKMSAQITFDAAHLPDSKFDVNVDVASAKAGNAEMTAEMMGPEMLDKAKFPMIHLVSSGVEKTDTGYKLTGTLEMHGVKKEISLPFTFKDNVFSGSFEISCKAYGMKGLDENSDKVKIDLSVPVKPR